MFRYGIMSVDDGKEPTNAAYKRGEPVDMSRSGYDVDDNMMH